MSSAPTPGKNDVRRECRANWQFALPPSIRPFGKTRQTANLLNTFPRSNR
jgi:hypothetical protein